MQHSDPTLGPTSLRCCRQLLATDCAAPLVLQKHLHACGCSSPVPKLPTDPPAGAYDGINAYLPHRLATDWSAPTMFGHGATGLLSSQSIGCRDESLSVASETSQIIVCREPWRCRCAEFHMQPAANSTMTIPYPQLLIVQAHHISIRARCACLGIRNLDSGPGNL